MPIRTTPLTTGEYYHVFNRGVNKAKIFHDVRDYQRALDLLEYYQFATPPMRFSLFSDLSHRDREQTLLNLSKQNGRLVGIVAFCLMPNHYHLLLQQQEDNGISRFMARWQISLARYSNTRHARVGAFVGGQFKAVHVASNEQLLHLSRYIHLNPFTTRIIKHPVDSLNYQWSSCRAYVSEHRGLCLSDAILTQFESKQHYRQFLLERADYQRSLYDISHLILE